MKQFLKHSLGVLFLLVVSASLFSQVKIGGAPPVQHSSLLELESETLALRITRITDTALIDSPKVGMIIFHIPSNLLLYRDSVRWNQLGNDWKIDGNANVGATNFLGTKNNVPVRIRVNDTLIATFNQGGSSGMGSGPTLAMSKNFNQPWVTSAAVDLPGYTTLSLGYDMGPDGTNVGNDTMRGGYTGVRSDFYARTGNVVTGSVYGMYNRFWINQISSRALSEIIGFNNDYRVNNGGQAKAMIGLRNNLHIGNNGRDTSFIGVENTGSGAGGTTFTFIGFANRNSMQSRIASTGNIFGFLHEGYTGTAGLLSAFEVGNLGTAANRFAFRYTGASDTVAVTGTARVGIGTSNPNTSADVNGGLSIRPSNSINATVSSTSVTVGNRSYFRIGSDNTPANRSITLSAGLQAGQVLVVQCTATGSNGIRLADSGNLRLAGNADLEENDTLSLIWDGSAWIETSRSDN